MVSFSALQRAENSSIDRLRAQYTTRTRFSALQRAENSSMLSVRRKAGEEEWFQCSSASRKFLNVDAPHTVLVRRNVSVLFSEPKIPQ